MKDWKKETQKWKKRNEELLVILKKNNEQMTGAIIEKIALADIAKRQDIENEALVEKLQGWKEQYEKMTETISQVGREWDSTCSCAVCIFLRSQLFQPQDESLESNQSEEGQNQGPSSSSP